MFDSAETAYEMGLGKLKLHGRIDRIDRVGGAQNGAGQAMLIDYKTESLARSKRAHQVAAGGHTDCVLRCAAARRQPARWLCECG
jgi:RecB family exonuclease